MFCAGHLSVLCSQQETDEMIKHTEEFKQEAVRIALTSGLPRDRVASDLGIGKSTLGKWVSQYRPSDLVAAPQADLARENERLRLENPIPHKAGFRRRLPVVCRRDCSDKTLASDA